MPQFGGHPQADIQYPQNQQYVLRLFNLLLRVSTATR